MLAAVAAHQGIESDLIPKIATVFCSGQAQTGGQCGALTAGLMALSMVEGRAGIEDEREALYQRANLLVDGFSEQFEHTHCPDLIQLDLKSPDASEQYQARGLKSQCEGYIRQVTERTVELLGKKG